MRCCLVTWYSSTVRFFKHDKMFGIYNHATYSSTRSQGTTGDFITFASKVRELYYAPCSCYPDLPLPYFVFLWSAYTEVKTHLSTLPVWKTIAWFTCYTNLRLLSLLLHPTAAFMTPPRPPSLQTHNLPRIRGPHLPIERVKICLCVIPRWFLGYGRLGLAAAMVRPSALIGSVAFIVGLNGDGCLWLLTLFRF